MAYVLSSVSGNLISAASAGYAPTNSGDVSAIASAYQVVSSTATQLYAGTAYVTSVNDAPISAARAGNAANASMANSAYYDGTGRLISALPDSAAVSAIASAYAESAASSKLDSSASSSFYPADNPSGFISSVDLSDYATTAYVDSSISGFAYDSAVSGWTAKQDALTFGYDTADKISSINGSSFAGEGGGGAEYSGIAPIHVDNDTHEISADVVNMDLQQITHDDTMVHVSNSASYALGVNYNYSGAPWNEGLVLKSGLLYSNNNPATGITSYALSDNVSSYYKLDVNFYDINDWHTRMECLIPSGILPSGARGGYFNAVANLPNNVWFKCFRWSAIGTNWYCQVDEIAGTNGTNTPTFNVNQNLNPPKVLSIVGWYKDGI